VTEGDLTKDGNLRSISKRLLHADNLPEFEAQDLSLDALIEEGDRIVFEVCFCL
jgi:hypothetical protein